MSDDVTHDAVRAVAIENVFDTVPCVLMGWKFKQCKMSKLPYVCTTGQGLCQFYDT